MKNFVVSARKYRPQRFADLKGQEHITETLRNAVKNRQVASAFLFCGPRGSGKTTSARLLAKAINCLNTQDDGEPCNQCDNCNQKTPLNIYELDAASHSSAEETRTVVEGTRYRPVQGKKKVIIIDEAHGLSNAALNVLLKPLEDTPDHVVFVLVTTEKRKIIPTILSRCQIFDFRHIELADITAELTSIATREGIVYEQEALALISQKALGSMRDALSIFDLIVTFSGRKELTYSATLKHLNVVDEETYCALTKALYKTDVGRALCCYDTVFSRGIDSHAFITGLAQHLRNLLVAQTATTISLMQVRQQVRKTYQAQAKLISASFIYKALSLIQASDVHYKTSANRRLHVEMMLINIGQINMIQKAEHPLAKPASAATKPPVVPQPPKKKTASPQAKPYRFMPPAEVSMVAEPPLATMHGAKVQMPLPVAAKKTRIAPVSKPIGSAIASQLAAIGKANPRVSSPPAAPPKKTPQAEPDEVKTPPKGTKKATKPYTDQEKLIDLAQANPDLRYLEARLALETV